MGAAAGYPAADRSSHWWLHARRLASPQLPSALRSRPRAAGATCQRRALWGEHRGACGAGGCARPEGLPQPVIAGAPGGSCRAARGISPSPQRGPHDCALAGWGHSSPNSRRTVAGLKCCPPPAGPCEASALGLRFLCGSNIASAAGLNGALGGGGGGIGGAGLTRACQLSPSSYASVPRCVGVLAHGHCSVDACNARDPGWRGARRERAQSVARAAGRRSRDRPSPAALPQGRGAIKYKKTFE